MQTAKHFTVTAFVSTPQATLLHWHRKIGLWLPPGGHVEPGEDPVQAVLREALEETGIEIDILHCAPCYQFAEPEQVTPPVTIMVEPGESNEGPAHQHVDMIYFARPPAADIAIDEPWRWIPREQLVRNEPIIAESGESCVSEDVRVLGIASIDRSAAEVRS